MSLFGKDKYKVRPNPGKLALQETATNLASYADREFAPYEQKYLETARRDRRGSARRRAAADAQQAQQPYTANPFRPSLGQAPQINRASMLTAAGNKQRSIREQKLINAMKNQKGYNRAIGGRLQSTQFQDNLNTTLTNADTTRSNAYSQAAMTAMGGLASGITGTLGRQATAKKLDTGNTGFWQNTGFGMMT